jgi:hypothetical protein
MPEKVVSPGLDPSASGPRNGPPSSSTMASNGLIPAGKTAAPGSAGVSSVSELSDRIAALSSHFHEVATEVEATLAAMRDPGLPPSFRSLNALGECHRQFLRLRQEVVRLVESLKLSVPPVEQLTHLGDLRKLVEFVEGVASLTAASYYAAPAAPPPSEQALARSGPATEPEQASHDSNAAAVPDAIEETHAPIEAPLPVADALEPVVSSDTSALDSNPWPPAAQPHVLSTEPLPAAEPSGADLEAAEPVSEHESSRAPDTPFPADPTAERLKADALGILERSLRISLRDGGDLPELRGFLDQAEALRNAIATRTPGQLPVDTQRLACGDHPIARLLASVETPDALNDSEWAQVHSAVVESFGRPLAIAMARNRLVLRPENP